MRRRSTPTATLSSPKNGSKLDVNTFAVLLKPVFGSRLADIVRRYKRQCIRLDAFAEVARSLIGDLATSARGNFPQ
jgi:hypothetical protein